MVDGGIAHPGLQLLRFQVVDQFTVDLTQRLSLQLGVEPVQVLEIIPRTLAIALLLRPAHHRLRPGAFDLRVGMLGAPQLGL